MKNTSKPNVRTISKRVICFVMAMTLLFGFALNSFAATKKSKSIQCKNKYGGGYGSEIKITCKKNETIKVYFTCQKGTLFLPNSLAPLGGSRGSEFSAYGAYEIKIIDNKTNKVLVTTNKNKTGVDVYNKDKSATISFNGVKGRTYTIKAWFWRASTTANSYSFLSKGNLDRDKAFWSKLPNIFANVTASNETLNTMK